MDTKQLSTIRKIVVFRALFLGDLLMTVPTWRALRQRFPEAQITLIGLPWASDFVAHLPGLINRFVAFVGYPGIAEVEALPERTAQFLAEQQAECYDLAIQLHGDGTVTNELVAALGARSTLGYARPGDERLIWHLPHCLDRNEVLRWLELLAPLGVQDAPSDIAFPLLEGDDAQAARLLARPAAQQGPLIGLQLGSKEAARRWPPERFAALGSALVQRYGATLVLTGSEHERPLTAVVREELGEAAIDLAGRTSIGTLAAVLARLDLLITNDTGASHLAAATRTRSVVLFGPSRPWQFAPLDGQLHRAVDALEWAAPGTSPAEALAGLPVEPVLQACAAMLAPWHSAGGMEER